MTNEQGVALEIAFENAFDELLRLDLEVVWSPKEGALYFFSRGKEVAKTDKAVVAGRMFAKVLKGTHDHD